MNLVGSRQQQQIDDYFDYSNTITTGGTAQLCLPQRKSCSKLVIANISNGILLIQIGVMPATATIANGTVSAVSVNDAGFGFQCPPDVFFLGGGNANDPVSYGATMPGWPTPNHQAQGRAIMGASAISGKQINSIEIDNPGSGYTSAPFVYVRAARHDPTGVGLAANASGSIPLAANGGAYYVNGTACPTTAISIYGATTGQAYTVKWMP
jgi:hypothetical protein